VNQADLLKVLQSIRFWQKGDQRAPHKPLLMLYALAQLQHGNNEIVFKDSVEALDELLATFGPPRKSSITYPFIRLANDGIWQLQAKTTLYTKGDYSKSALIKENAIGQFTAELRNALNDPNLFSLAVTYLLDNNFPETLRQDILDSLGLNIEPVNSTNSLKKKQRDPDFRNRIIEAYESKCAVCGYQVRKGNQLVGLEAAHIKWHQAGGPDTENNGVALCSMHHKLYDYGLLTIDTELMVKVSTKANGAFGLQEWLLNYHGRRINLPHSTSIYPEPQFLIWQVNEVFKGSYSE
jgi:putative restriction endonuclease